MIGQDLLDWLESWTQSFVDDHLDIWKDRYYRRTPEWIEYDLSVNYDWSSDIEWISEQLDRKLCEEEVVFLQETLTKAIYDMYYLKG